MLTTDMAFGAISTGSHYRSGDAWDDWCAAAARTFESVTKNTALAQKYYDQCTCNAGGTNRIDIMGRGEALLSGQKYVAPTLRPPCSWGPPFLGGQGLEDPWGILGHLQRRLPPHFTTKAEWVAKGEAWNYWRWGNELRNEVAAVANEIRKFLQSVGIILPAEEPPPQLDTTESTGSTEKSSSVGPLALGVGAILLLGALK